MCTKKGATPSTRRIERRNKNMNQLQRITQSQQQQQHKNNRIKINPCVLCSIVLFFLLVDDWYPDERNK